MNILNCIIFFCKIKRFILKSIIFLNFKLKDPQFPIFLFKNVMNFSNKLYAIPISILEIPNGFKISRIPSNSMKFTSILRQFLPSSDITVMVKAAEVMGIFFYYFYSFFIFFKRP